MGNLGWFVTVGVGSVVAAAVVLGGDIDPPAGPVAPTMKTIDKVEPRIAVNVENTPGDASTLYIISQPGSYYLTGNIVPTISRNGIRIASDNVTLDLNGFVIDGAATSSRTGITSLGSVTSGGRIMNGEVRDWPNTGIFLIGEGCVVQSVTVRNNSGAGMQAPDRTIVRDCTFLGNGGNSIRTFDSCIVEGCVIESSGDAAIAASSGCLIRDNVIRLSSSATDGISVTGIWTRVEGNNVTGSSGATGIRVVNNCFVGRNTVTGSVTTPYDLNAGAKYGPVVTTDGDLSTIANGDHPYANFVY